MNADALLVMIERLVGTRISPNWMLNSLAMRHSPTASCSSKPVPGALAPVPVPPTVVLPRLGLSVSTKKNTFGATCPLRMIRAPVSYTHLRAHETDSYLVCRLLL